MIDVLSANLGDPQTRLTRLGFASTLIYAAIFFYSMLFGASVVMGLIGAVVEIGFGLSQPGDLMIPVTAAILATASGAIVVSAGASRLRDMGHSFKWLLPAAVAFAIFTLSETGLLTVPDPVVTTSILVVAATVLALCILPGRDAVGRNPVAGAAR